MSRGDEGVLVWDLLDGERSDTIHCSVKVEVSSKKLGMMALALIASLVCLKAVCFELLACFD